MEHKLFLLIPASSSLKWFGRGGDRVETAKSQSLNEKGMQKISREGHKQETAKGGESDGRMRTLGRE